MRGALRVDHACYDTLDGGGKISIISSPTDSPDLWSSSGGNSSNTTAEKASTVGIITQASTSSESAVSHFDQLIDQIEAEFSRVTWLARSFGAPPAHITACKPKSIIPTRGRYGLDKVPLPFSKFRSKSLERTVPSPNWVSFEQQLIPLAERVKRLNQMGSMFSDVTADEIQAKLININDRWLQLRNETYDLLIQETHMQVGYNLPSPWEKSYACKTGLPYYTNHRTRTTQWDHPFFSAFLSTLDMKVSEVCFATYRIALKARQLQRFLLLGGIPLPKIVAAFARGTLPADAMLTVMALEARLRNLLVTLDPAVRGIAVDLNVNWVLRVCDVDQSGCLSLADVIVALVILADATSKDKLYHAFAARADPFLQLDCTSLHALLTTLLRIPQVFGEETPALSLQALVETSLEDCYANRPLITTLSVDDWVRWTDQNPRPLVWISVLGKVAAAENITHYVTCSICDTFPIEGFRYRCLKCVNANICQKCFFAGSTYRKHNPRHPIQEYAGHLSSADTLRTFASMMKNRFMKNTNSPTPRRNNSLRQKLSCRSLDLSPVDSSKEANGYIARLSIDDTSIASSEVSSGAPKGKLFEMARDINNASMSRVQSKFRPNCNDVCSSGSNLHQLEFQVRSLARQNRMLSQELSDIKSRKSPTEITM